MHTQDLLAADTGMGAVTLRVADLDTMVAYYRDGVGLQVLTNDGGTAVLGRGATPIVVTCAAPSSLIITKTKPAIVPSGVTAR